MVARQKKLPHVLAHGITPNTTAGAVTDVVEHFAIDDERTGILVILALVTFAPSGILDRAALADQVIGLHVLHDFSREGYGGGHFGIAAPWIDCSRPGGDAVVHKICLIRRSLIQAGRRIRLS